MNYDKLVRDRIPEIIELSGKQCIIEYCNDNIELKRRLVEKLSEEGEEYLENFAEEELADLLQVVYSLIEIDCIIASSSKTYARFSTEGANTNPSAIRNRLLALSTIQ